MEIKTERFEGSLDLLLFLVKKHKMNPLELRISEITDEFIAYVNQMDKIDIETTSDFILMASTLMEIKSRMLLNPSKEVVEKQEEIAKKLYEYSLAKEAMERMERLYNLHSMEYDVSVFPEIIKEIPDTLPDEFIKIFNSVKNEINLRKRVYRITRDLYSFSKKMETVKLLIAERKKVKIGEIISMSKDKLEAVVTFVTVLELLRLKFIVMDSESSVIINEEYNG